MVKIIDRRSKSMGGNDKRAISRITNIAVHYSATSSGNTSSFERFWKNNHGWNTGGYHEVVLTNGDVELNYNADTISNGVGGQNTRMYNICYVGDGAPNAAQLKALIERVNYNRNRFGIAASAVKGHREFSGQSTSCPGLNMGDFRKRLSGGSVSASKPAAPSKPKPKPKPAAKASLAVDGKAGKATVKAIQVATGSKYKDGVFSGQPSNSVTKAFYGGISYGSGGSPSVGSLQKYIGEKADNKLGPSTIRTLQKRMGTPVDGVISRPYSNVIAEAQKRLNKGTF